MEAFDSQSGLFLPFVPAGLLLLAALLIAAYRGYRAARPGAIPFRGLPLWSEELPAATASRLLFAIPPVQLSERGRFGEPTLTEILREGETLYFKVTSGTGRSRTLSVGTINLLESPLRITYRLDPVAILPQLMMAGIGFLVFPGNFIAFVLLGMVALILIIIAVRARLTIRSQIEKWANAEGRKG